MIYKYVALALCVVSVVISVFVNYRLKKRIEEQDGTIITSLKQTSEALSLAIYYKNKYETLKRERA